MAGMTTANSAHLIRSQVWSQNLKDVLLDELQANKYVDWMTDFPEGNQFHIPSIGTATVRNYAEGDSVVYDALDTGDFSFTITEYLSSATYISKKNMQDGFYMDRLTASFVPKQARALQEQMETTILGKVNVAGALATGDVVGTAGAAINGQNHRLLGTGAAQVGANNIGVEDFARAKLALKVANVPQENLIAIVDPTVEFSLNRLSQLTTITNNPKWEGIVSSGIATGMRFLVNIFGFDVYTSNYLPAGGAASTAQNIFFSASQDVIPFVGAMRQLPEVDSEYNKDRQREEYITTARYGVEIFRPENLVVVETSTLTV